MSALRGFNCLLGFLAFTVVVGSSTAGVVCADLSPEVGSIITLGSGAAVDKLSSAEEACGVSRDGLVVLVVLAALKREVLDLLTGAKMEISPWFCGPESPLPRLDSAGGEGILVGASNECLAQREEAKLGSGICVGACSLACETSGEPSECFAHERPASSLCGRSVGIW